MLAQDSDRLILDHLWVVRSIAARLKSTRLFSAEWDELISAGNLALVKAGRAYRGFNNCQFKTYAFKCIYGEMLRSFTRIDGHNNSALIDFRPLDEVEDQPYPAPQETQVYESERRAKLDHGLNHLKPRHRMVIDTYLAGESLVGLAKNMGMKRDRIMKWQRTAIKQLTAGEPLLSSH